MIELFKEKSLNRNMDEKRIESIIIWGIKLLSFDGSYWQDLNVLWGHTLFFWYFCLLTHSQKLFSGHFFFPVSLIIFKSAVFQIFGWAIFLGWVRRWYTSNWCQSFSLWAEVVKLVMSCMPSSGLAQTLSIRNTWHQQAVRSKTLPSVKSIPLCNNQSPCFK